MDLKRSKCKFAFLYFAAFDAYCSWCPRCVHSASNGPHSSNLRGLYSHFTWMANRFLLLVYQTFKYLLEASVELRNLSILYKALNTLFFEFLVPWEFGATSGEHPNHVWKQQGCWFGIWCCYEGTVIFTMWPFMFLLFVPLLFQTIQCLIYLLTAALAFHQLHQFSTHLLTK